MKAKKIFTCLFILFSFLNNGYAQSDFNIKLSTLAIDVSPSDDSKLISIEPGIILSYEFFMRDRSFAARFSQGIRLDNKNHVAGFTTGSFQQSVYQKWKTDINISVGAGIAYVADKKTGNEISNYSGTGKIKTSEIFITGGIEFNYFLNRNIDLSMSINNTYPSTILFNAGIRYWITKKIKKRHKCSTCPDWS